MLLAQKFGTNRNWKKFVLLPDMAPVASLAFLVLGFILLTARSKPEEAGIVSDAEVPFGFTFSCLPENTRMVVSLNVQNQLSFSVSSRKIQVASIRKVASAHGINFIPAQVAALATVSYLRTDVENLPNFLSLPAYQRNKAAEVRKLYPLSELQLIECVQAAKVSAEALTHKPIYFDLKIHADVKACRIERLTSLLNDQGVNTFTLLTQAK